MPCLGLQFQSYEAQRLSMLNQLKALVSVKASSFKRTLERGMEKLLGLRYLSLNISRI